MLDSRGALLVDFGRVTFSGDRIADKDSPWSEEVKESKPLHVPTSLRELELTI